jgi:hypothetical protein
MEDLLLITQGVFVTAEIAVLIFYTIRKKKLKRIKLWILSIIFLCGGITGLYLIDFFIFSDSLDLIFGIIWAICSLLWMFIYKKEIRNKNKINLYEK